MRSRFLLGVLAAAVVVASAPASLAAPHPIVDRVYHCTLIARDQDLAPLGVNSRASINAYGQVAFATGQTEDPFESEIRTGYGDEIAGVPQTRRVARGRQAGGAAFLVVSLPSIENNGRVVYFGEGFLPSGLGSGIFRARFDSGGSLAPTPLVETAVVGELLPDATEVFFEAPYTDGASQRTGLFRNDTLELDLSGIPELHYAGEHAYDAGGSRAYAIQLDIGTYPNIESRLYLGTQQVDTVPSGIGLISGLSVASSVNGMVSYGRFDGAGFEVRVWADTPLVYVDSDDDALVASGTAATDIPTSINAYGEVALVAGDGAQAARRVFLADGDVIHRVLCENDGILALGIGSRAINSAGQIAFNGVDGQGQAVVARADPLQRLPVSCAGQDEGSACDDGDPETAASCRAGECVGNPIERPTSCLAEPDDTPCDEGDPATPAFCENGACVPVPLPVPEPDASALVLAALAVIAFLPRHKEGTTMSRRPFAVLFAVLLGASAEPARAAARSIVDRNYECRIIASTREFPLGPDWLGPPAMNAWGQVVFTASTRVGAGQIQELRVGRGDEVGGVPISNAVAKAGETINGPLGPFGSIEKAAIDDAARVTFLAYELSSTGGQGIYRVFTNQSAAVKPTPLYTAHPFNIGDDYIAFGTSTLDANAEGSVVFEGTTGNYEEGYRRNGTVFARNYANGVQIVQLPVLLHAGQPWTAFTASLDTQPPNYALFVDGAIRAEAQNGEGGFDGLSLSGNASPVVSYTRSGFPGIDTWEIAVTGPIGTDVYVDADVDPFEPFGAAFETSINVWGEVAFVASPAGDGDTLLVSDGSQQIRRVVCQNQFGIFGGPFFDIALSPHAINADGQIAFKGRSGTERFLVRADPLPGQGAPPTSCAGQLEGARCDDGDPITQSSCQSNACTGNPLYDPPTSCVGLGNDTACNDGNPATISYCDDGVCVGIPLPVPEPAATWLTIAALFGLTGLRRAR